MTEGRRIAIHRNSERNSSLVLVDDASHYSHLETRQTRRADAQPLASG